jgi:hypothetical protein
VYQCEAINTVVCSQCLREGSFTKWVRNELLCPHCKQPPEVQIPLMTVDDIDDS